MSDFRLRKQKKEKVGQHYDIFNRPKKRPNSREAVFNEEFVMGFHERKDLRRKKAQEDLKELEKKTRREGRKMRQQHMLAVLNQMRGIGDIEEGLRPKEEEESEEEVEEQVLEHASYEDNAYKITTEVADVVEKKKKCEDNDANTSEEDDEDGEAEAGELESSTTKKPVDFNPRLDYSKLVKPAPKKRTKRRRDTYSHSAAKKNAKKRRKQ